MMQASASLQQLGKHAIASATMLSLMLGSVSPAQAEPLFSSLTEQPLPTEVQKSPLQEMKVGWCAICTCYCV